MPISVACTSCATKLKVADNLAGRSVKCPKCSTVVKVVAAVAPAASAPAAPAAKTSPRPPAPPSPKAAPAKRLTPKVESDEDFDENVKAAPGVSPSKAKAKAKAVPEDDEDFDENVKAAPGAARSGKSTKSKKAAKEEDDEEDDNVQARKVPTTATTEEVLDASDAPEHIKERVQEELSGKERLVWLGQPDPKIMMVRGIPQAIMGLVFAIIGCVLMFTLNMGAMGYIGPGLFLLIGLGMCFYPLFQNMRAKKMSYALTNRRCIVWTCNLIGQVKRTNYEPAQLVNMRRAGSWIMGDGAGDVIFKTITKITTTHYQNRRGGYAGSSTSVTQIHYGFLAIRRAQEVEQLIRETLVDRLVDKLQKLKEEMDNEDED